MSIRLWGTTGITGATLRCALMLVALPVLVLYLWLCLNYGGGALIVPRSAGEALDLARRVPGPTLAAVAIYLVWFAFQALLQRYAPGPTVQGAPLADGSRLSYRLNGVFSFWLTWIVLGTGVAFGVVRPAELAEQALPLLVVANLFAFGLAGWLLGHGRRHRDAPPRQSVVCDYVMGTTLNPRTGGFDWKLFCEARPGLIGWLVLDFAFAAAQLERHGTVTLPMILVLAFQFLYVADYFLHEEAILSTWDVRHERFGWMLCWGNLVWVPFTFSLQAAYLATHPHDLPPWAAAGIVLLNLIGYAIFRTANLQKHRFRRDLAAPVWGTGRPADYIQTTAGARLLVSGWWGRSRHANYFGDMLMALAWSLPTGAGSVVPYFYVIYLVALLVHRERRDNARCAERYGRDWDEYCRRVRWRIVPGVY